MPRINFVNIICFILGAVVVYMLTVAFMEQPSEPQAVEDHNDMIKVHRAEIDALMAKERAMIAQYKKDSATRAEEKKAFKAKIKRLERRLEEYNFKHATAPELDSIRFAIYGDSVSSDTLYSLPIDQARDMSEAKAAEITKDSIIFAQRERIIELETDAIDTEAKFKEQIKVNHDIQDSKSEIEMHLDAVGKEYKREIRKQKRMRWIDRVLGGAFGFAVGRIKP